MVSYVSLDISTAREINNSEVRVFINIQMLKATLRI